MANLDEKTLSDSNYDLSIEKTETSTICGKYKTELCNNFMLHKSCKYESKCKFAHGKHELVKKANNIFYKSKPCETFFTKGICPYGSRCTFRHDERTLISMQKPYHTKIIDLLKEQKRKYDKSGLYEESNPYSKADKPKRLSIFNDITDDVVSFSSKRIALKIEAKKNLANLTKQNRSGVNRI